ncbi:MAG: XamI family restriction endonuclease [Candidatus Sulfotelmatobacter sp.]
MIAPPRWTEEELDAERAKAREVFRQERMQEPLEQYLERFDQYQGVVEDLLETTIDVSKLDDAALDVLTNPHLLHAFRYFAGPPISEDDLRVLAEAVLTPSRLRKNEDMVRRIIDVVRAGLDRRRFPWVAEGREPSEAERSGAVLASAALIATSWVSTSRRSEGKGRQETLVEQALIAAQMKKVPTRPIQTMNQAPHPGEFCRESQLGSRKADFIIGTYDQRLLALECKVSNSEINSIKRLNNDAAAKATTWLKEFGNKNVVPAAVLSGVFKPRHLLRAQDEQGCTIFWAHDITAMIKWIQSTKT